MVPPGRIVLVAVLLGLVPDVASARSFRVAQVPNGSKFGCALCHINPLGGPRNGFGVQVEASLVGAVKTTAQVDWAAIYDLDGDSDGYSNGRELGDPDGTWVIGTASPAGETYAPFDRTDSPCGDGVLEDPEDCDTDQLPPDATCEMFGWGPGTLSCASTCRINQEQCEGYEVVIPNNANPPPVNTNNSTTTPTNNTTAVMDMMTVASDETADDSGGCATAGPGLSPWALLALLFLRRRRRQSAI